MNNKLIRFRVKNFRSVMDSGWISLENINCLVGTNESGKTNLLVALWKLHPSNDEPIIPLRDYPRSRFDEFETKGKHEAFVYAHLFMTQAWAMKAAQKSGFFAAFCQTTIIAKTYSNDYKIFWVKPQIQACLPVLQDFYEQIVKKDPEDERRRAAQEAIKTIKKLAAQKILPDDLFDISNAIDQFEADNDREGLTEILTELRFVVHRTYELLTEENLCEDADLIKEAIAQLPTFVFYSDYGNIDSEIYLPHVIEDMSRDNLGEKEQAKVRTLKVLFDFLKLDPKEILALGNEDAENQVATTSENKKKREILLQSASLMLTKKFKELWKQGDYKFRLQADGNYLRIWVSDSVRPDEVELEARSKGLQWFLSFFLVFFIESAKKNTTILLDEAGLSLHPLAQKDLLNFINYLAEKNQIIYTTHSPYLVDPAIHTQVVYVSPKGLSTVLQDWTSDKKYAKASIFTIQSALWHRAFVNLDYDVVIVSDTHEQIYLQQMSFFLAAQGLTNIHKPILFLPAMHGLDMVVNLLGYYPKVLGVLEGYPTDLEIRLPEGNTEIEDMMPKLSLAKEFSKMHRNNDGDEFDEHFDVKMPFIDQAIDFADKNNLPLELSWRNELAKKMVAQLKQGKIDIDEHHISIWKRIFAQISGKSIVKENIAEKIAENIVEEIVIDNKQEVSFAEIKKQLFSIKQKINFIEEECEDLEEGEILSKELAKLKKNIISLEKAEIIEEFSESSIAERLKKVLRMIEKSELEEQIKDEFIAKANFILDGID